jgi:Gas vesicle synthesis protein GvpL/GvpF
MNEHKHENTWVYGVVPAGAKLKELGRRRDRVPADVRIVEMGDLGVIVGDAPANDAKATRDQALTHARVLEAAVVDAPVVPFRFGMVMDDSEVDRELLDARHDEFAELLDRVKDRLQFTLKATYDEDAVLREIIESQPEIAQLREHIRGLDEFATRDARVRLGELVSVALEQLRQRDSDAIVERLSPFCISFTIEPLESEFMALNAPFLVERAQMEQFDEEADALAGEQAERMHFTLMGPMPAYNFVGVEGPAWA